MLGYAADIANDGREALQRLQLSDYALLLTDLHMPEMDGFELTKNIRSQEAGHKHIPIVALTANALKGEREHCLDTGMDDYLTKPAQLEDLRSVLEKYLSGKPIVDNASVTQSSAPQSLILTHEVESAVVPVDVHVLEKLVGDDPDMIKEMLQDYRVSAGKTATELRAAYQTGQWVTVGSLAHKLKSSSRSVGALVLGELCAEMEQAGKNNDAKALVELLPSFDAEMAKVAAYLASLHEKDA